MAAQGRGFYAQHHGRRQDGRGGATGPCRSGTRRAGARGACRPHRDATGAAPQWCRFGLRPWRTPRRPRA